MTTANTATSTKDCHVIFWISLIFYASLVQSFHVTETWAYHIRHPASTSTRLHKQVVRTAISHHSNEAYCDICWKPSCIKISNLSHQYPETLWRKLTSSEPRRAFAVEDLSLTLEPSDMVLLLGDSSSGKSTLLKLILGLETPISGDIQTTVSVDGDNKVPVSSGIPVLLEQRPVYSNRPQNVQIILQEKLDKLQIKPEMQENDQFVQRFLEDLCGTLGLPMDKKGSDLSPSETYCCAMAEASIESMLTKASQSDKEKTGETAQPQTMYYPAPILLLDEWMDKETSTVVQNVQSSILKLVDRGAIVVSITHKPNLYKQSDGSKVRSLTLRRGKLVA